MLQFLHVDYQSLKGYARVVISKFICFSDVNVTCEIELVIVSKDRRETSIAHEENKHLCMIWYSTYESHIYGFLVLLRL